MTAVTAKHTAPIEVAAAAGAQSSGGALFSQAVLPSGSERGRVGGDVGRHSGVNAAHLSALRRVRMICAAAKPKMISIRMIDSAEP